MDDWMTSMNRKKRQRHMNRVLRKMNQVMRDDELWDGRFYVRQNRTSWYLYEDHSGGELFVELEFVDRKTGKTKIIAGTDNEFCHYGGGKLYWEMNEFIVQWCDVWSEVPNPYEQMKARLSREED